MWRAYTGITAATPGRRATFAASAAGRNEVEWKGSLVPVCEIQTSPGSRSYNRPTSLQPR